MDKLAFFRRFDFPFYQAAVLGGLLLVFALPLHAEVVNINRADAATLQHYLKGVGEVKAKAIVAYRDRKGSFNSPEELTYVPGIGPATVEKNRKNISVKRGVTRLSIGKSKAGKMNTSSSRRSNESNSG